VRRRPPDEVEGAFEAYPTNLLAVLKGETQGDTDVACCSGKEARCGARLTSHVE